MPDKTCANTHHKKLQTRSIGIDYGNARIGLAFSDATKMIASPLVVVPAARRSEETVKRVAEAISKHQKEMNYSVDNIIVGLPLNMNGTTGLIADDVHHFVALLKTHFSCPIILWDERLTSVQADRAMRESAMTRKKRSQIIDTVCAVILLQNWLDHRYLANQSTTTP